MSEKRSPNPPFSAAVTSAPEPWPYGFRSPEPVPGFQSCEVAFSAPGLFRPRRLLIPASLAKHLELVSCVMNGVQYIERDPVPCEAFAEESVNQGWRLPTLQPGESITMVFRNLSGGALVVRGAWFGLRA